MPSKENDDSLLMTNSIGSLKFEVVLEPAKLDAVVLSPRSAACPLPTGKNLEEIRSKLKLAEGRRMVNYDFLVFAQTNTN